MRYHDFTLEFAPGPAGGLTVRVADSPARQGGFEPFEPPPVEADLEIIAVAAEARAEAERSGAERGDLGDLEKLSKAALRSLGARLFEHLFRGTVRRRFEMSLSGLGPEDGLRIKIRLDLNEPALVPLLSLPWELLFEGENGRSFGLDQRFSIVRFLPQRRVLDRRELPRPLRILLATAEPRSSRLLSLDDEVRRICEAVARPGEIEVQTLAHATLESLRRALSETEFHVLHFMGHGDFDPESGEGELHFEDGRRGLSKVPGQMLADVLRGRASLRLVFLNACRTARTATPKPFAGVATALVQAGVPAVLAMQFPIADSAAIIFSEAVYLRLAAGDPIDAAVAEGRKAMFVKTPKLLAWGTPVLFSHVPDGRLFGRGDFFQTRKPTVLPFPSLGPLFHGRDEMLWLLHDRLAQAPPGRATAIAGKAVHGLGGVGKTRLAVEFAWRYAEDYSALLFVGAGSPADLRRNLAALCAQEVLDLPEREEKEEEVREAAVVRWLAKNSRWLLILDNVDSEEAATAVDALVARLHGGYVLLTGRLARWGVEVEALELDLLTEEASVAFLLARTDGKRRPTKDDEVQANRIAEELGYLPLALEQAGAYIVERRLTLARYWEEWQSKRHAVLFWFDPRVSRYPASVAVTWQTSVDQLSASARFLLELLAWLGQEPIPETMLDVLTPALDEDPFDSLVELSTYSLVTRAAEQSAFRVHRLVQETTRSNLKSVGSDALQAALLWTNAAFEGDPEDVRSWRKLEPLAPHVRTVVTLADESGLAGPIALLMGRLGRLFLAKALYGETEPLLRRALAIDELNLGLDHSEVATDLGSLAILLQATNRLFEAEPLMRRALEINERNFGPKHPNVATSLNNLAQLLRETNRLSEAEALMRRGLAITQESLSSDHPDVAIGLSNLALLLQYTDRPAEAELLIPPYSP